ncbi:MAG: hypothetical protein ABF293_06815 [Flavobacteriaceae bacterium]
MRIRAPYLLLLIILLCCGSFSLLGQTNEQKQLEAKRERLQEEINEINRLLFAEKKQKGTILDQLEVLDQKINVRQQLIRVTNQQANLLSRQINTNIRNISKLREDLEVLKNEYAEMIRKSYQNKSQQNRLMFLLSSETFFQALKRLEYMKQYTQYRKMQGEEIAVKTAELTQLNQELTDQKSAKEVLIANNLRAKNQMMREIKSQKELLKSIRQNESKYASEIRKKTEETKKLDR